MTHEAKVLEQIMSVSDPGETLQLGESCGRIALPGLVIALYGRIGAGKTTFVRGLVTGLGLPAIAHSPTFTLVAEYLEGRIPLYHMDLYRLGEQAPGEIAMLDEYFFGSGVCAVEWADLLGDVLPEDRIDVRFLDPACEDKEGQRQIAIRACGSIASVAWERWVKQW